MNIITSFNVAVPFSGAANIREAMEIGEGIHLRKDDALAAEKILKQLTEEIGAISTSMEKAKKDAEDQYRELHNSFTGVKADNDEVKAQLKLRVDEYADMVKKHQDLTAAFDSLKKELDAPILKGGKDLEDSDRKAAVELQRRIHLSKGGTEDDFKEDLTNLVKASDYRSAARKLMKGGIETREKIVRDFTADERKAFDNASLDSAFFMPEMLGIEIDCNIECAELIDLYSRVSVSRSTFMYPKIVSYGDIGQYDCDAKCDAELGDPGNIQWLNGKTYDFRGVFCFQKKVLQEANYDLLSFMFRAAFRSHRINRNAAMIMGDGISQPRGWLAADCFPKLATPNANPNHQDWRRFIASAPVEYGPVVATMHQNFFAYLASALDNSGRFIFGDGLMTYSPSDVRERIRISNCLPDPTDGNTLGSADNPFVAGSFLAAAGNWEMAYYAVDKRPMFMEQYIGGSSAWCVKYQFGAEDGGFVGCCDAARVLVAGS